MEYGDPNNLLFIGVICTGSGFLLFRKALVGDNLMSGTLWTRIPTWMLWVGGLMLQAPLPIAVWFLKAQGVI